MRLFATLLLAAALTVAGCGGPSRQTYATPRRAVEAVFPSIAVEQEVAEGPYRVLLFRPAGQSYLVAKLVAPTKGGQWRAEGGHRTGPLRDLGPIAHAEWALGDETIERAGMTISRPRYQAMYGTVRDLRTTWVEVTLLEDGTTRKVPVVNGTWLALFPYQPGPVYPKWGIRGGDGSGELFHLPDAHAAAFPPST